MKLAATAVLALSVHEHLALGQKVAQFASRVDHSRQLEQLAEADHLAADGDLALAGGCDVYSWSFLLIWLIVFPISAAVFDASVPNVPCAFAIFCGSLVAIASPADLTEVLNLPSSDTSCE